MKLLVHRTGLPGEEIFVNIVPLDPAYKAGLAGYLPVNLITPNGNKDSVRKEDPCKRKRFMKNIKNI